MAVDMHAMGIDQLSVGERLELIDRIWDSLPDAVQAGDIPAWHLAEIDRRRAAAFDSPKQGKPWRELMDELESKP